MAVKSSEDKDKLILELDNGDRTKFKQIMDKWNFKDEQSLLRFAMSLLILNENDYFGVKIDGRDKDVIPAEDYLKSGGCNE